MEFVACPGKSPEPHPLEAMMGFQMREAHLDTLSEGFSYFVTSIAAPAASGWSVGRVGLAPTGKRRLSRRTPGADVRDAPAKEKPGTMPGL